MNRITTDQPTSVSPNDAKPVVSSIREFVGQKLDYWVEADVDELGKYGRTKRNILVKEYSELLKFIDAL